MATANGSYTAPAIPSAKKDSGIGLMIARAGKDPSVPIAKIEICEVAPQRMLELFRKYVRESTAEALRLAQGSGFTYVEDYDNHTPLDATAAETHTRTLRSIPPL